MPKKSLSNDLIRHMLNEAFERHNLFSQEYTADVIEHLFRYHWEVLEGLKDLGDLDALCIHADLASAFNACLSDTQKRVVLLVIAGHPATHISKELGINATRVAKQAYRAVSDYLNGKVS